MNFFINRFKSVLLVQLILGIIAILFVIVGWTKDFHPGYMLTGMIILAVMLVINGLEQSISYKRKSYLVFTIIVSGVFIWFWIWRYSTAIKFY